jgi:hypothetical protein
MEPGMRRTVEPYRTMSADLLQAEYVKWFGVGTRLATRIINGEAARTEEATFGSVVRRTKLIRQVAAHRGIQLEHPKVSVVLTERVGS